MQVKTNLRAGKGGASGAGHNTPGSAGYLPPVPPVSRCVGI
jgi:hypothetical protein